MDIKKKSHGGEIHDFSNYNLIDFSTNINHLIPKNIYKDSFDEISNQIARYPDSNSNRLKKTLCSYFKGKLELENMIITNGSMELISLFADTFIQKNNKVVIYQPSFSEYEWVVNKRNGRVINIFRDPLKDFQLNLTELEKSLSYKPKCVFICNPNNPNGSLDDINMIEKFISMAEEENVFVFLDEAFIDFTGEKNSLITKTHKYNNLLVARSFTKFFGIPGLRIGYGGANSEIIKLVKKYQISWSVNCFAQNLAEKLINSQDLINRSINFFLNEREYVIKKLSNIENLKLYPSDTNFILINTEKTLLTSHFFLNELIKHDMLIRNCSNYEGLNNYYIRIAIKSRYHNDKLIEKLTSIIKQSN